MEKDKNLLDVVKSSLKVLEDDISFLRNFDVSLPSEISNFLERMNSRYASAIEKIVREDESGYSDLEDILVSVNETRLQQYQKAAKSMLRMTRKELKSAFWFRDQFSLSQRIDDIEKRILEIDSSLISKEPTGIEKSINLYRDQINALGGIQNSFQWERRRSRLGISLKVLLWSIPILIGIWISGKFDNSTIVAFIGIIFLSAALSYLTVGIKRFEWIVDKFNAMLAFIIAIVIALITSENFFEKLQETLVKRNFVVVIPTIDKSVSSEDKIVIPYSLENKRPGVITEIGVSIFAPGLSVLSKGENINVVS